MLPAQICVPLRRAKRHSHVVAVKYFMLLVFFTSHCVLAHQSCSDVVSEYVRFHNATWGTEAAKYVIFSCPQGHCNGGLGDRMRGLLFTMRLAITYRRVLLVNWSEPFPLEEVFGTSDVDWRIPSALDTNDVKQFDLYGNHYTSKFNSSMHELQSMLDNGSNATFSLYTNIWHGIEVDPSLLRSLVSVGNSRETCWFNAFFKPTHTVSQAIAEELLRMGVMSEYVAVHLRIGGLEGEEGDLHRIDRFEAQNAAIYCAKKMAVAHDLHASPVVFVTDNRILRFIINRGYLSEIVGPSGDHVSHIVTGSHAHEEAFKSFVELGILAKSSCTVTSRSGYSNVAMWWSGNTCASTIEACRKDLRKLTNSKLPS